MTKLQEDAKIASSSTEAPVRDIPQAVLTEEGTVDAARVLYYTMPLESKRPSEVLKAMESIVAQINAQFSAQAVFRIHGDAAHEVTGPEIAAAFGKQGILVTKTPGYEPNNNGRAEKGIGLMKGRARANLMRKRFTRVDRDQLWACSVQHASWQQRAAALRVPSPPAQRRPANYPAYTLPVSGFASTP